MLDKLDRSQPWLIFKDSFNEWKILLTSMPITPHGPPLILKSKTDLKYDFEFQTYSQD